jgi:hypothetical protein
MLKCEAHGCTREVVGGKRELIVEKFLDGTTKMGYDKPVFYCGIHEVTANNHFTGKQNIQTLTKEQLDYWRLQGKSN